MRIDLLKYLLLWLFVGSPLVVNAQGMLQKSQLSVCLPQEQSKETHTINHDELGGLVDTKASCDNDGSPPIVQSESGLKTEPKPVKKEVQTEEANNKNTQIKTQDELEFIEKELKQERLKLLFIDMNSVVENVGYTMDWTANYLDSFFAKNELGKNKAKTWGHFVMGWEPREGEVFTSANFPIKFKIKAKLPNLENKVEIILSDGEDDDFQTLPYESVRPEAFKISQSSLGAAVRFLHTKSDNVSTSGRIGWGENQLYTRASATYRKKLFDNKVIFNMQPAIEYYVVDGWGARFLLDAGYKLDEDSELRYNFSLRDLESYDSSEWRSGLFHISSVGDKAALIVGLSSFGYLEPKPDAEQHRFSTRYRFNALRSWIFFEIEPFYELHKAEPTDENWDKVIYSDFVRDYGIALRFEAHYGFL